MSRSERKLQIKINDHVREAEIRENRPAHYTYEYVKLVELCETVAKRKKRAPGAKWLPEELAQAELYMAEISKAGFSRSFVKQQIKQDLANPNKRSHYGHART